MHKTKPISTTTPVAPDSSTAPPHPAGAYCGRVKLSDFWDRMREQFGTGYAESVARDHVLGKLGGRTVDQALAAGTDAKAVWRAVCEEFDVPPVRR